MEPPEVAPLPSSVVEEATPQYPGPSQKDLQEVHDPAKVTIFNRLKNYFKQSKNRQIAAKVAVGVIASADDIAAIAQVAVPQAFPKYVEEQKIHDMNLDQEQHPGQPSESNIANGSTPPEPATKIIDQRTGQELGQIQDSAHGKHLSRSRIRPVPTKP